MLSRLDEIRKIPTDALVRGRFSKRLEMAMLLRRHRKEMPSVMWLELARRGSTLLDDLDSILVERWLLVAPAVRIEADGALKCEDHKPAFLAFALGKPEET